MSLAAAGRLVVLWLGWLLSADAVAGLILGSLSVERRLLELALGTLLLVFSTSILEPGRLLAGVIGLSALAGLLRIAYMALSALLYDEPHPFSIVAYAWRAALFLALGVTFLRRTRDRENDAGRAA